MAVMVLFGCFYWIFIFVKRAGKLKENTGGYMRPPITKEEVELLMQDMEMLAEQQLVGLEALEALRLLEMRRQTGKLEAIKRLISHGKE
ncbi:hypothetical protein ACT5JT_005439 [Klebsiella pneumoniae]|nr:hypothetical protein [Klebsiella pneumoniae]MEC6457421.1 hypothetical protein [Klebsiella pneumoniae]